MDNTKGDIDLLYILRSAKNGIANLFNWVVATTMKKIGIVLAFVVIGIGLGFLMFSFKKPVFVSELTISHMRFDNDECFELINNLTKLNENPVPLSRVLKADLALTSQVKSINYVALNARTTKLYTDSAEVMLPFRVMVEVYDPGVLDSLQSKLMNYLEMNPYGVKRKEINMNYLMDYGKKIQKEILAIDTLKQIVNQSIKHKNQGNGVLIDEPVDPVKISQRSVELQHAELKLKEQEKLNDSFELMVGFNGGVRKTANMMLSMFYGLLIGYLVSLLWLYSREKKA
jgi:hypothetical protein